METKENKDLPYPIMLKKTPLSYNVEENDIFIHLLSTIILTI